MTWGAASWHSKKDTAELAMKDFDEKFQHVQEVARAITGVAETVKKKKRKRLYSKGPMHAKSQC